jgi:hypothetical protein
MDFEWDPQKASINARKHGVQFVDAQDVFEDDRAILLSGEREGEERWIAIGSDLRGRILVVVFTYREERIRLVSARRATPYERRQYKGE